MDKVTSSAILGRRQNCIYYMSYLLSFCGYFTYRDYEKHQRESLSFLREQKFLNLTSRIEVCQWFLYTKQDKVPSRNTHDKNITLLVI